MAFVTPEELLAAKQSGKFYDYGGSVNSIDGAKKYIQNTLDKALKNQQGCKHDRPWVLVDLTRALDPTQPWIGFEFETGFDDKDQYTKFINFLWNQDHTAIDREGTGKYPVEVAFAPQNLSDVLAGKSTLQQTIEFVEREGMKPARNPTTFTKRDVGIHAGLSTPKQRALGDGALRELCVKLSRALGEHCEYGDNENKYEPTKEQKELLYGRSELYWGSANARHKYIELKMFRAIPETERIKGYIQVVARVAKLVDWWIDNPEVANISNSFEFLSGQDELPIPAK